ncbi:hypothetical protein SAMN05660903_02459 [Salegentibacter salinarum]|nr:hypothetical protein [Salegentibacter salinarum]SKB76394.1 hypothetical protein SAMN05660903_02459 [Salegentibacter salinarum]
MDNYWFYKTIILKRFESVPKNQKKVFIEIDHITLNRYLYNFIKFFTLNNYTVYIPKNKRVISVLNQKKGEFVYGSWILKERVRIGEPENADLVIGKNQLSNNYFRGKVGNSYHVPMSEYPGIYRHGFFNEVESIQLKRKRSIFMSGNIDAAFYNNISKAGFFEIPSRSQVADFLKKKPYSLEFNNLLELKSFINEEADYKVVLVDTSKQFRIPLKELKNILQKFNFYLALPGILIPQSHNLIEAMSVGCIPVIHRTYAELMFPPLKNMETALVYDSWSELDEIILYSFNLEKSILNSLRENVLEYFSKYLSPGAVVKKIEENDFSTIYIQAEEESLTLLKKDISE